MLLAILIFILYIELTCSLGNILIRLGFNRLVCCIFSQSLTCRRLGCYLIVLTEVIHFGNSHASILLFSIFVIITLICLFQGLTSTSTFSSLHLLGNQPKPYYTSIIPNCFAHHAQVPHELTLNTSKNYSNPSSTALPPSSPYFSPSSPAYNQ